MNSAIGRYDAIVVGGGLAGVTAARNLAQSGATTLLVEARERLGGRTVTQTFAGRTVDTGGAHFHWFQSAIWSEIMRYELPVVETVMASFGPYLVGDSTGWTEMSAAEFDERLRRGLEAFWGGPSLRRDWPGRSILTATLGSKNWMPFQSRSASKSCPSIPPTIVS